MCATRSHAAGQLADAAGREQYLTFGIHLFGKPRYKAYRNYHNTNQVVYQGFLPKLGLAHNKTDGLAIMFRRVVAGVSTATRSGGPSQQEFADRSLTRLIHSVIIPASGTSVCAADCMTAQFPAHVAKRGICGQTGPWLYKKPPMCRPLKTTFPAFTAIDGTSARHCQDRTRAFFRRADGRAALLHAVRGVLCRPGHARGRASIARESRRRPRLMSFAQDMATVMFADAYESK